MAEPLYRTHPLASRRAALEEARTPGLEILAEDVVAAVDLRVDPAAAVLGGELPAPNTSNSAPPTAGRPTAPGEPEPLRRSP